MFFSKRGCVCSAGSWGQSIFHLAEMELIYVGTQTLSMLFVLHQFAESNEPFLNDGKPCSAAVLNILLKPAMGKQGCSTRKNHAHLALVCCLVQENEFGVTHVSMSPYKLCVVSILDHLWRREAPLPR